MVKKQGSRRKKLGSRELNANLGSEEQMNLFREKPKKISGSMETAKIIYGAKNINIGSCKKIIQGAGRGASNLRQPSHAEPH